MAEERRSGVQRGVPRARATIIAAVALVALGACGDEGGAQRTQSRVDAPTIVTAPSSSATSPPTLPATTAVPPTLPAATSPPATAPVTSTAPPPPEITVAETRPSREPDLPRPLSDVPVTGTDVVSTEVVAVLPAALTGTPHPPRVLVAGDSTGTELAVRFGSYAEAHVGQIEVFHSAFAGCGLTAGTDGRLHAWNTPTEWIDLAGCTLQWEAIPQLVADNDIDVVIAAIGPWDGTDIRFLDGSTVNVLDPVGRALVQEAYDAFVTAVRGAGATPVFIRPATIDAEWERRTDPLDDPRRWDVMREIVDATGAAQIDLPGWLAANGLEGPAGRPDGVHLAEDVEARFIAEVIVPETLRLAYV